MKLNLKKEIYFLLLIVLAIIFGFYFYENFPERIVSHWNFSGIPDGYSGKFGGAFGMPIVMVFIYILFLVLPYFDPKKERYEEFSKVYNVFKFLILLILFVIYLASGFFNLGYKVSINLIVPYTIGIMFLVMGNYMGKIKPNWFVGIRTPWTLSSEQVWNKTHRVGGYIFMALGILLILIPHFNSVVGMGLFVVGILSATLGIFLYSYWIYKKEVRNT